MSLFDRLRRRRPSPDGSPENRTSRSLFVASAPPQNVDKRPPAVTERAQVAHQYPSSDPSPADAAPHQLDDPLFAPETADAPDESASPTARRRPTVRVDEVAIEQPAPRRALSPAEALHLASGTTPSRPRPLTTSPLPTPGPRGATAGADGTPEDAPDDAPEAPTDAN